PAPSLASPELTGDWEARLARIARRQESRSTFMHEIAAYVRNVITAVRTSPRTPPPASAAPTAPPSDRPPDHRPRRGPAPTAPTVPAAPRREHTRGRAAAPAAH